MRHLILAFVLLSVAACSRPSTCQRMSDRMAVAKTFCVNLVRNMAEAQCEPLQGKPDHEKCIEVIGLSAVPDCLLKTGYAQIEATRTEFCE